MGGSSTYGIEQSNGSVIYNVYTDTVFHDSILYQFRNGKIEDIYYDEYCIATSVEDYYSEARFEGEDSVVRGLLRLNGLLEWRHWGDEGHFTYTKKK
jgi:hypothetical protein